MGTKFLRISLRGNGGGLKTDAGGLLGAAEAATSGTERQNRAAVSRSTRSGHKVRPYGGTTQVNFTCGAWRSAALST